MEGKYFAGWSVNKDAAEPDESFFATGNMTLYAVYKEGYTVTCNANGGSGSVPESVVVPKGAYKPEVSKPFPVIDGKYFKGWADAADAAVPMATVNIIKDTTLYAVYTDERYFSTNLSGFAPGSAVTAYDVKDGYMHYSNKNATSSDVIFENKNTSFNAEDYPYVRVKLSNEYNGAPTGGFNSIFFISPTSGYSGTLTRIPPGSAVAKIGDMSVLEVYIPGVSSAVDNYHGKISAVRFDPVQKLGATGYTDYVVFTNKKGIYKADVTVDDNGNVTLSDETKNCSATTTRTQTLFGDTLTVILKPDEGYEFTTPEDVVLVTTINGKNPDGAVVLADGSARIRVTDEKEIAFGSSLEAATEVKVDINTHFENKDIVVAVYSNHGTKLEGLRVYNAQTADFDDLRVKIADSFGADTVRVFVFDNLNSIAPVCRPFETVFR